MTFYVILLLLISLGVDFFSNRKNSVLQNVKDSFHNNPTGFSARKLSAFVSFSVAAYVAIQNANPEDATSLASIFLLYSLLCLGIVTAEQIVRFREGNKTTTSTTDTSAGKTTTTDTIQTPPTV